ncbi:MAG: hypothetical protein ACREJQ_02320 [bacterium]
MDPELKYCAKSQGRTGVAAGLFLVGIAILLCVFRGHPERAIDAGRMTMAQVDVARMTTVLFVLGPLAALLFGYAGSLMFLYDSTADTQSLVLWGRKFGEKTVFPRMMLFVTVAMAAPLVAVSLLSNIYWDLPAGALWMASFATILYVSGIAMAVATGTGNWIAGLISVVLVAAYFGFTAPSGPVQTYPLKELADPFYLLHHPQLVSGGLFNYGKEGPMYLVNQTWNIVVGALLFGGSSYYFSTNLRRYL